MAIARRFVIRNASRAKNVATRGVLTRSQSTKIVFDRGSAPDPALELTMLPHSRLGGDTLTICHPTVGAYGASELCAPLFLIASNSLSLSMRLN